MKNLLLLLIMYSASSFATETHPDCSGIDRWATSIAYTTLKNNGMVTSENIVYEKTITKRFASEKIGTDLYKQVHHVTFTLKSGATIQVITVNDASSEECSMSGVDVYVISKKL